MINKKNNIKKHFIYILNETDIESIKKDKKMIKQFCNYLIIEKRYKQIQVADLLNYDIKKIYYIIKKIKKAKSSPS